MLNVMFIYISTIFWYALKNADTGTAINSYFRTLTQAAVLRPQVEKCGSDAPIWLIILIISNTYWMLPVGSEFWSVLHVISHLILSLWGRHHHTLQMKILRSTEVGQLVRSLIARRWQGHCWDATQIIRVCYGCALSQAKGSRDKCLSAGL